MFIITGISNKEYKKEYVGTDSSSGGYPYWTSFLFNAKPFETIEDAKNFLNSSDFNRISKMSDGNIYLPRMLSEVDMKSIKIEEIVLTEIEHIDFSFVKVEYLQKKEKVKSLKREIELI